MKKPGAHFKFNDETSLLIVILAIVVLFIAFIKPIYNFMGKVKSGSLFEKHKNSNVIEENKKLEDNYAMLTPTGADRTKCSKTVSDEGGDKVVEVVLYHTAGKLQSITANYKYSGMTNDYSNYIFLAHSQFKEKKTLNLKNKGYSIEYKLSGNNLSASEVYLLNNTSIKKTGDFSETKDIIGELDQDIAKVLPMYISEKFTCEGGAQ